MMIVPKIQTLQLLFVFCGFWLLGCNYWLPSRDVLLLHCGLLVSCRFLHFVDPTGPPNNKNTHFYFTFTNTLKQVLFLFHFTITLHVGLKSPPVDWSLSSNSLSCAHLYWQKLVKKFSVFLKN